MPKEVNTDPYTVYTSYAKLDPIPAVPGKGATQLDVLEAYSKTYTSAQMCYSVNNQLIKLINKGK